ncbi:MAG: DUF6171 family protein [Halanaerobiales bacterium]
MSFTMGARRNCKGCSSSVRLSEQDLYDILKNVKLTEGELVDEELYKKRLACCKECSDLLYDTTCKYTGYLVYVKAREINTSCPKPGKAKW